MTTITLGFSPCPNDTFVFHALVHDRIPGSSVKVHPRLEDVETLNQLAFDGVLDVTKVSFGALPYLLDDYVLLRSGGALGRGCGPLIVSRELIAVDALGDATIAIPGRYTTANLLFRLFCPEAAPGQERQYDEIMPAVEQGEVDAGLIIHESRFTYPDHGLRKVVDLGEWWEESTGSPIPLGAIVAHRRLGQERIDAIESAIRESVQMAFDDPSATDDYVREHAQELSAEVMRSHIELYVNEFSVEIGESGERAIGELFARGQQAGILPMEHPDPFHRRPAL